MANLARRATEITERMDEADCDADVLSNTYRQFGGINATVSGWPGLYREYLRPAFRRAGGIIRLLDVGCGGGDVLQKIARWASKDGFRLEAVGIDPDARAIDFVHRQGALPGITFRCVDVAAVAGAGELFDVVISNHVLHHLRDAEVAGLCQMTQQLATRLVLHNDIRRHPLAYAGFPLIGGWYRDSFILEDGLRSIQRSFTPDELRALLPEGWQVRTRFPFRCLLLWDEPS